MRLRGQVGQVGQRSGKVAGVIGSVRFGWAAVGLHLVGHALVVIDARAWMFY